MVKRKKGKKKAPIKITHHIRKFWYFYVLFFVVTLLGMAQLMPQKSSLSCANSLSCISNLKGTYEEDKVTGEFLGQFVTAPAYAEAVPSTKILGVAEAAAKRIEIDLSTQTLHAIENNAEVFSFPISSGKWGRTPTGEFSIWIKLRYTRMKGGSKELNTYYDLPNVPHTMFFYNDQIPKWRGFGIHGAYWHNNFGHPMSHGCINVGLVDVERLYNWATPVSTGHTTKATDDNPGTKVIIYGTAPNE